jgi:deoxyadenosine/deoxycytidine kinase
MVAPDYKSTFSDKRSPLIMNSSPLKLSIVAVMAAGKTSVSKLLAASNPDVLLIPEPVEKWRQSGHLERFYQDKRKHAFAMQWNAVKTRYDDVQETLQNAGSLDNRIVVLDGHMQTDRHGFVQTLFEDGDMIESDKHKYETAFDELMPGGIEENEFFVYLRCKPEICLARAKSRARSEEVGIPLEYLKHLHNNFEVFSQRPELVGKMVILDVSNKDLNEVMTVLKSVVTKLRTHKNLNFDLPTVSLT